MAKKKKSFVDAVKGAANASRKGAEEAISQGKGTPVQRQKQQARGGGQSQQRKYQDGQYGQFIKNSRLGQSGAAQRNNNQKQQQEARRKQQKNNRAASTYGELNERVNQKNQQRAKQQSKSAHRFENATKGTLQQTLGSHATTFYAARNPNEDKYIQSEERRKQQGEKNHSKFSEGQYGQLVKKERSGNVKEREKNLKKASELIDKGNKNIEKSKEGLGKGGRFAVDTYSAMLGMATDAAAGPFSMGSMASRSFGAAYDTAKKEGANDTQAALYGASQAAVETGTEKMFALAKPLKKLYGAGVGDDVAEKLLEKMAKKASTKTGKELAYHGGKTAMAALSEGLEEMVSEGLEPALANQIYANATGTPHSTSAKDVLYAGAVGGAMGGILGGGGQAVEYNQGRKIQNVYGNDGLKTMAKKLRDVADEASGRAAVGELINRTIDEGQPVTSVQSRRLYQAAAQQEEADFKRQSVMNTVASNEIAKKNFLNPVERDQEGNMLVGETTRQRYDESVQNIVQRVKESGMDKGMEMPDSQVEQIASAVSAIKTGVAGTNEVNMFLVANPKARTVYETITGEKLPAGNTDTKEALYARIAANRVESAKLETEAFTDRVKGGMAQDVAKTYEPSGQAAFEQMMVQADIADAAQTQNDIAAFDDYYRAGRNGIAYETVARMNNPAHQASSSLVRQAAWEAGASDAVLAADTAKGVQMEIGKKISQSRSKGKSGAHRGKVISELSQEAKRNLPASRQRMFRQLARVFNVNIHIVDEAGFNGKYEDGEVYLSVQGDRDLPYIFSHEITHHMQDFAPVEYNELKELIRQAWAEKGGIDEAVNDKIAQYAENDVQLTYEDALDEIIADSTYEMIQDEGFAEQLCSENRTLSQKILDAIKNVLSKLRQVLVEGDGFTPAQNAALLSQLDILKDAEKLWTDGLVKAAENRDAVGSEHEETAIRYSKKSDNESSVREQLRKKLDKIAGMESVANVKYESMKHLSRSQKAQAIMEDYNKKFKGGIQRQNFGFIVLREDEVTGSLKYLHTDGEYAAFKVLPQVLKRGEIIDEHIDHKKRNIDTVTIAAPVIINDTLGYMAAVVKVGGKNRYHVHRILMPDGSEFEFNKKTEPIGAGMSAQKSIQGSAISPVSTNSIPQTSQKDNEKFSLKDSDGRELSTAQQEYFKDSKIRNESGNLLTLYHQTGNDFTVFDTHHEGAGSGDWGTPYGIFMKPNSKDIGLRGSIQMELYANITNPLKVRNRSELDRVLKSDEDYSKLRKEYEQIDVDYKKKFNDAKKDLVDFITKWRKDNPDAGGSDIYNDPEFNKVYDAEDAVVEEWTEKADEISAKCKEAINSYLESKGHDGIILDEDKGSFGRSTKAYIALYPEQVKSTNNPQPTRNHDVRFSFAGESALNADNKMLQKAKEMYDDFEGSEDIRKETGWHRGADGKWRFEIDDSRMKVFTDGDALFRKAHPEYVRLQDLYEKFWKGDISDAEQKELTDLNETWGSEKSRLHTRLLRGNAHLADIIQHDVLFENYPQLSEVTVKIGDLDGLNGANGAYVVNGYEIRIDEDLFKDEYRTAKRDGTLVHEIQHAIQDIEQFAKGANLDTLSVAADRTEAKATTASYRYEAASDNLLDALEEAGYFDKYGDDVDITSEDELVRIKSEYKGSDSKIEKLVDEFEKQRKQYDEEIGKSRDLRNMSAKDFYKYAAGEVEARDSANRLKYNSEERRANRPDIDSPTVLVEDYTRYSLPEEPLYRFSNSENPMSEMGHAMFADSEGNVEHYGQNRYVVDANKLTSYDDVKPLIEKAYDEAAADDFDSMKNFDIDEYSYRDKEAFMDSFDPDDIIDNADGYDNPGMNAWLYEYVLEPNGIAGIRTQNGGVVYDESLIQNAGKRRYSLPDEESIMDYAADRETEFVDVPPVRDYERKARGKKVQTIGELRMQVDKLKADKKLTRSRVLDKKSVKEQINDMVVMLKSYGTVDGKKTDLKLVGQATDNIASIYRYLKEGDYPGAVNQAYNAAQDMVDNLHLVDDSMFREYKELRDLMRTTKISISEEDAANIPDFKDWKKSQFGRLRIGSDGMGVDTFYQVLTEKYPELFDHGISHPADQLQAMADVRESMEPFDILLDSEERSDLIKQAAQDMIDIAATGKPWKSWADRKKETYDEQVKRLKQRQKEALRDVRQKSKESKEKAVQKVRAKKDEQIKAVRQKGKEKLETEKKKQKKKEQKRKAQAERRKRFERIEKNHKWLSDRLLKPTDDKHIPEEFKTAVAHLLSQIDLQTERSKNLEAKYGKTKKKIQMDDFRRRYAELAREDGTGLFEYDGYIFQLIDSLADKMNGRSIDECSDVEIAEFDTLLKAIRHNIQNYNKAFSDALNEDISNIAEETINKSQKVLERKKGGKNYGRSGAAGAIDAMLNESMVTPRDFFERLGGGMNKVFGSLRKGFDRHVDNITNAREFFDGIFTPYNKKGKPGSKIEKWRNASQSKEFEVYGGKITLNPAQIMSLYCLSKRDQAMGHILGGGIVASRVDAASKIKQAVGAKIESRGSSVMVTMEDIAKITASLTPEQRAMADQLQGYLNNECAEWGNETSMRLYGYRKFTEKNYFPIKSADTYLDSNIEGRNAEERIRNFGFTKGTVVNANNPIMIDDIFRVTADHINKMSLYNAFAAPISDFMRVYNFKARDENGQLVTTVKAGLEDAYGKKALNYINNFMADVNNQVQTRTEGFGRFVNKSLANYKKATIGFNARVALQQPTAIMRAFILMNPKYFVNGSVNVKKNLQDMKAHCQTARWKSWGFSQVDMARDIDQIMMNSEWSKMDVLTMQIYGALDNVTWSYIWAAVRKETEAKHPDVQVDSEEFYRICNERAAEVFDKTQVVDSVFNRSQVMRNTDTMSKMLTSFMAEPTRTYNMMRTEFAMAKDLWNEGEKGKAIAKMNRACSVFMLNAAAVSAAAAVADAFRGRTPDDDDKDDDSLFTNFLYNFWDNVNPANMIPVAKDIWGAKDGWSIKNMALSGYESLVQAAQDFAKDPSAENARSLAEGFGLVAGLPIKNIMREMKVSFGIFGIDVFAAEEGDTGLYDRKEDSLLDKILSSLGLGKTEQQKKERDYEKEVKSVEKAADGLTGSERQEAIWKAATEKYSTYIEDGDMSKIYEMRKVLEATGGDVDKFDKSVRSKVVTAYKKNIGEGGNGAARGALREYLLANGYTEAKISQEIVAKSDTAKKFQEVLCLGDEEAEYRALGDLLDAGIYDTELQTLYQNRVKSIDADDYSTGEMVNPVSGQITSGFGYRNSPGGIGSTNHKGIDIAVPEGTDVAAADGGTITKVDYNGSRGVYVEVTHGNGRKTRYQHLSGYYVQKGDVVKKGQTIAASGNTGHSTGPHLHFEVLEGGTPVNPMNYLK